MEKMGVSGANPGSSSSGQTGYIISTTTPAAGDDVLSSTGSGSIQFSIHKLNGKNYLVSTNCEAGSGRKRKAWASCWRSKKPIKFYSHKWSPRPAIFSWRPFIHKGTNRHTSETSTVLKSICKPPFLLFSPIR